MKCAVIFWWEEAGNSGGGSASLLLPRYCDVAEDQVPETRSGPEEQRGSYLGNPRVNKRYEVVDDDDDDDAEGTVAILTRDIRIPTRKMIVTGQMDGQSRCPIVWGGSCLARLYLLLDAVVKCDDGHSRSSEVQHARDLVQNDAGCNIFV
jgi:hypothetical protein